MPITPVDDGLTTPEVGPWCMRKYHFLGRYLDAFTTAMRKKWAELHYVDLFAGAGFARLRQSGDLVAGSPVIAANLEHPFTQLHLCDVDPHNTAALQRRLAPSVQRKPMQIVTGDANDAIGDVLEGIPQNGALCVAFADPFGLHLDFETVRKVAEVRSDLIILLADNMDAVRNWATYYFENPNSSLDRFMGEGGWRDTFSGVTSDRQATAFREHYQRRLESLGYSHFAHERIRNSRGNDIYALLYASRVKIGVTLWNRVSLIDERGQRSLHYPE